MRITIVSGFFLPLPPLAGGAMEKIWWRLTREFAERGHNVAVVGRNWPGQPQNERREGIQIMRVRGHGHRRRLAANLLLDAWWGLKVTPQLPPADILVTNTVALPVWIHAVRPRAGRVVVNLNRYPKGQLRWYRQPARIQAASTALALAARQQAPRWADRVRCVENPIDWTLLATAARRRPVAARPLTIGYCGRLHPEKGLRLLVEAAVRLADRPGIPAWRMELRGPHEVELGGGGDAFREELREIGRPLIGQNRLVFAPPVYASDALAEVYAQCAVFCYPTLAAQGEGQPVAVLEAMAAACPVVVTDLPCFADRIEPGRNALVLDRPTASNAADRLADVLQHLLLDPARREALGLAAQASVAALDYPIVAEAMLTDFAGLADARR